MGPVYTGASVGVHRHHFGPSGRVGQGAHVAGRAGGDVHGAIAGIVAAAAWKATDPAFDRVFSTRYSDARLVGTPFHLAAGAAFGVVFTRLGGRGPRQAAVAALVEHVLLWPAMLVVAPRHFGDARAFARSAAGHAVFGAALGALVRR
jgi:hypothetical protein